MAFDSTRLVGMQDLRLCPALKLVVLFLIYLRLWLVERFAGQQRSLRGCGRSEEGWDRHGCVHIPLRL